MKTFQFLLPAALLCLFNISLLQAQNSNPLLATTDSPVPNTSTTAERPALNRAVGVSRASFDNLGTYTSTYLQYPELARENSIEGTVRVLVFISPEGKITKAEITKSLGFGCDEAALAVVNNMPQWLPASRYGIASKDRQILEFNFRLR